MNNKKLGMSFERKACKMLAGMGYWVHFMSPDNSGAQPCDIIAVRDGRAMLIDCKTCEDHIFRLNRLEWNQQMAFNKWLNCGNEMPMIMILHNDLVYMVRYDVLMENGKIDLDKEKVVYTLGRS